MLAEAIVAAGLLVAALVALVQLVAASIAANVDAARMTTASLIAEQKVARLRAVQWAAIPQTEGVDYLDRRAGIVATGGDAPLGAVYVRRWSVVPVGGRSDLLRIDVRVSAVGDDRRDGRDLAHIVAARVQSGG